MQRAYAYETQRSDARPAAPMPQYQTSVYQAVAQPHYQTSAAVAVAAVVGLACKAVGQVFRILDTLSLSAANPVQLMLLLNLVPDQTPLSARSGLARCLDLTRNMDRESVNRVMWALKTALVRRDRAALREQLSNYYELLYSASVAAVPARAYEPARAVAVAAAAGAVVPPTLPPGNTGPNDGTDATTNLGGVLAEEIAKEIARIYYENLELSQADIEAVLKDKVKGDVESILTEKFVSEVVNTFLDKGRYPLLFLLPSEDAVLVAANSLKAKLRAVAPVVPQSDEERDAAAEQAAKAAETARLKQEESKRQLAIMVAEARRAQEAAEIAARQIQADRRRQQEAREKESELRIFEANEREAERQKQILAERRAMYMRIERRSQVVQTLTDLEGYMTKVETLRQEARMSGRQQFWVMNARQTKSRDDNYNFAATLYGLLKNVESTEHMQEIIRSELTKRGFNFSDKANPDYTSSPQLNDVLQRALSFVMNVSVQMSSLIASNSYNS